MSITEMSITNPKKQLEFYQQLSEQLRIENQQLKKYRSIVDELMTWLESKNKIELQQHKMVEPTIKVQEVLDKIKRGGKK